MKPFKIAVSVSLLSLCLAAPAFAQFNNEISNFAPAGAAGPEDREYYFRVPDGVEVVTRKGEVIKGGETIGIPGKYLTVLGPEKAEPMIKSQYGFDNKNQPVAQMTQADRRKYAVVAIQVPEGASVRTDDGKRVVKGPQTVYILALAESMFASDKMEKKPQDIYKATAFQSK